MSEIFTNIPQIKYEGKDSKNPFAFKFYDAEKVVLGKKMKEHLPFAMAWWHNLCAAGTDMFGRDTADKSFGAEKGTMEHAKAKVDAGFEFMQKLGIEYFCFHDVDLVPEAEDIKETNRRLDEISDYILEKMKGTNIKCLWGTANMFSNPRFMNGAGSTNSAEVYCFAAAQIKKALDLTVKLGGRGYVFWGGREGYETLLNTDMKFEQENIARLMKMAVEYGRSIGFTGDFYIEPKPKEPMKHQYDFDAATAIGFLRQYGLDKDFKMNIEANHATLAGHTFQHELRVSAINGMLGSIDANQGDMLLGWDTDEFPSDVYSATLCMYEVLKAGGLTGGFNFDSKNRRPSNTYEDMFHAFILGMDTFALGLIKAAAIIEDGRIDAFVKEKYASFESEMGKRILRGTTLEVLAAYAEKRGSTKEPKSGRQEYLEGILNNIMFGGTEIKKRIILAIDKTELRLNPAKTAKLSAHAVEGSYAGDVFYKTSDENVAIVDENGLVTAIGEGYAVITAFIDEYCSACCAVSVVPEVLYIHESIGNPYLPIWEHIPDGEPYVFEDPDNPGKYRVYVYGSHDSKITNYCGYEQVVWSAPVDDLTKWTYHGEIFKSTVQGTQDTLFAPDIAEVINEDGTKTYYFYPNNQSGGRKNMVAKSSRPDGPFLVCNWLNDNKTMTEGPLGYDVTVLRDDDGRAYGYWGFQNDVECCFAELDPNTMATVKEGTDIRLNLPTRVDISKTDYDPTNYNIYQDEYVNMWGFFEAPSIRKIGNKYVLIFSRRGLTTEPWGCNIYQLGYGYSDSPEGPWKWGGIIVDAGGEAVPTSENKYARTFSATNTHGSICEINGQWYVFYHRSNNKYGRQSMLDTITVEWDEKAVTEGGAVRISMAEMTSKGVHINGLDPYAKYPASIVCYIMGDATIEAVYDRKKDIDPVNISGKQAILGYKYFNFNERADGKETKLAITVVPQGIDATVDVYLRPTAAANTAIVKENGIITSVGEGSIKVGSFEITADMEQRATTMSMQLTKVDELDGQRGLFFVFTSESEGKICEFHSLEFSAD